MSTKDTEDEEQQDKALTAVKNARSLLSDFEEIDTESRHGSIDHAIAELRNARRELPNEY